VPPHVDPCCLQPLHERNGGRAAHVLRGRAPLEGEARDEDLGTHRRTTDAAQLLEHASRHVIGQRLVDLPRLLDDARLEVHLAQAVDEDEASFSRQGPPTKPGWATFERGYSTLAAWIISKAESPMRSAMRATSLANAKVRSR